MPNPANSTISGNVIFSTDLSLGEIHGAVKEFSTVKANKVYHPVLMPLLFDGAWDGVYVFRSDRMPAVPLDKFGIE